MSSFTYSQTFTETHAKHLGAKVVTDLKRIQRLYKEEYSELTDEIINNYELEIIQFLKKGYLKEVTYGFKRNGQWIEPTLKYTAKELANSAVDDDPGKVRPNADISGAIFGSFLIYSNAYFIASESEIHEFKSKLPIRRGDGFKPSANGYFTNDKSYYSGGKGLDRSSLKGH